ncbi:argininosuccinate synthase, partial [Vibrio vulnificus]
WNAPNEDCWVWTVDPEQAPNEAEFVTLQVEKGEVVAVDGEKMTPYNALVYLNEKGAKHGVGRIDIVENRLVGMKSRGCYETPGGTIMMEALRAVEQLVLDKTSFEFREELGLKASHLVYDGRWFTPLRKSIMAAADELAQDVNGEVVVKLYKGMATVTQK